MIETTRMVFFSPTHTSAKVARAVGEGIGMPRQIETDLTLDEGTDPVVAKDEVVVISVPVYAGRVAPVALQRLARLRGEQTPAVLLAVYGNRDYEDALVELRDRMTEQGFLPLGAGAFIGEHSYSRPGMPIAEGRPDEVDLQRARDFGEACRQKLDEQVPLDEFYVKGNVPYRTVGPSTPAAPVCTDDCTACGFCAGLCPTHAIRLEEGRVATDVASCIKCCACVKECPNGARRFDTPYTAMLHAKCGVRRESETFI